MSKLTDVNISILADTAKPADWELADYIEFSQEASREILKLRAGYKTKNAGLEDELHKVDDAVYDASADVGDAEHQIAMHEATLPQFVRCLVAHLKRIDAIGENRRQAIADALEPK